MSSPMSVQNHHVRGMYVPFLSFVSGSSALLSRLKLVLSSLSSQTRPLVSLVSNSSPRLSRLNSSTSLSFIPCVCVCVCVCVWCACYLSPVTKKKESIEKQRMAIHGWLLAAESTLPGNTTGRSPTIVPHIPNLKIIIIAKTGGLSHIKPPQR